MAQYILRRLLYGILVLLGVVLLIFSIFLFINVDPERLTLGQRSDVASVEAIRAKYGLDKPWYERFGIYLKNISPVAVHEDSPEAQEEFSYTRIFDMGENALVLKPPYLGRSYQTDREVGPLLMIALRNTLLLAVAAMIIAIFLGIILGVVAAVNHGNWIDQVTVAFSSIGVSVPSYFSAVVLSFVLGYIFREYTGLRMTGSLFDLRGDLQLQNLILPAIALGLRPVAVFTQLTRSAMLDVLSQDYVRTARAKGLSFNSVLYKHALRNALNPVVTSISGWFASLLAGAYFVEVIFDFKGLGYVTIKAIEFFDFPVIMGSVLLAAVIFVIITILLDLVYVILDPRVKLS